MSEANHEHAGRNAQPRVVGDNIPSNPFSTRHVRPGALPFVFRPGEDAEALVAMLRANDFWGEIVGPHGSGKSTLLATLLPCLVRGGRSPLVITLHDGERSLAAHQRTLAEAKLDSIVVVDGFEQLAPWNKWRLRRFCRRRAGGLLVTAHASTGLPRLATTAVDLETAEAVFRLLVSDHAAVDRGDLARALTAHAGDLREALSDLYDLHEMRRRGRT